KSAEECFVVADPAHLGLTMEQVGASGPDLLADKLLANGGDPDLEMVRSAAPPMGSTAPATRGGGGGGRVQGNTFVGTKEGFDTMPVFPTGNTRTYHPNQYFPELKGQQRRSASKA